MKKIALLLVVVIVFSLCGCSNKTEEVNMTEILTSGKWKNESGQSELEFYKSGTGSMGIPGGVGTTFTWTELENNCIRVESQPIMGVSGVYDFELVQEEDTYRLVAVSGKESYMLVD